MRLLRNKELLFFSLIVSICFQLTDVKFYDIKISELLMLLSLPFLLLNRTNKYIFYLLAFFSAYLVCTFAFNLNRVFYLSEINSSFLKKPYWISIARYLELVSCISLLIFVYNRLNFFVNKKGYKLSEIINSVLLVNLLFAFFFLFVYVFYKVNGTLLGSDSFVVHNVEDYNIYNYRLRGFYFEGGPFGLFFATLFMLTTFLPGKNIIYKVVFLVLVFLAKSKAGILMIILWILYNVFINYKLKGILKVFAFSVLIPVFIFFVILIASNYVSVINNIESTVAKRPDDYGLVMGRIAGIFIVPQMLKSNPILGIGLGNYPLVRNNPDYLGIFPAVPYWDEHGLGGIVSLLVEGGLLFFVPFVLILYLIFRRLNASNQKVSSLMLLFIIPCLLGVQLHFMYIWFIIGLVLFVIHCKTPVDLKKKIL